jgi:hypothetical protein
LFKANPGKGEQEPISTKEPGMLMHR